MAKKPLPAPEVLRQLLRYEPDTGKLFWREREGKRWLFSGKEAFTYIGSYGYCKGTLMGISLRAHRVIWAMNTNAWPELDVDHINGIPSDNRWINLRLASRSENMCNISAKKGSEFKGVSFLKNINRWQAEIQFKKKRVYLGCFTSERDAAAAYDKAAEIMHGQYARLNFPETNPL